MANEQHLKILKQGVRAWNEWRERCHEKDLDLRGADLTGFGDLEGINLTGVYLDGANLSFVNLEEAKLIGAKLPEANLEDSNLIKANLRGADLKNAKLTNVKLHKAILTGAILMGADLTGAELTETKIDGANLYRANLKRSKLNRSNLIDSELTETNLLRADLTETDLTGAILTGANLNGTNFFKANLTRADLSRVNLIEASFYKANLTEVDLTEAHLVKTNFEKAYLTDCNIYGISAWGLLGKPQVQTNLIVTPKSEPKITVDNLEVAQFIYLMLHNQKIRDVINTIGKKGVLILGRFTPIERKEVLDAIREKLRNLNYVPIVFDFERPTDRDFTETIKTLAGMCRFIVADITNPKSSPLELQALVPDYMIPLVPIIHKGEEPFAMFKDLANKYDWVLKPVLKYDSLDELMNGFEKGILKRALEKHEELMKIKNEELGTQDIGEYQ